MPGLAPLTGGQLRRAALSMGKKKAPGADGLQAGDWTHWPKMQWDRLADLVQLCEEEGRWPELLRIAHVMLLSKGGKPVDKLQARPITVLPLVYRAWAKVRAKQLRTWLEEHTELLVGHRQAAEFQAAVLATVLSLGKATGEQAGAVCLDFSKAYDSLDLEFLEQALRRAGVSEQILRLAFSMYRAFRVIRVGDAVGPDQEPGYGLPAGCPFATFFMAVVTQPWRRQLRLLPARPSVRTWVDDCTAFVLGEAAAVGLAGAAGRTAASMERAGSKVNVTKSGCVATTPLLTEMMRLAAGPLFGCREPLKDLGVVQGSGAAEAAAAMARWSTACDRLAKVARLSCTMAVKGTFAAAAAMSAGVYATSCREQPDKVMENMRRWRVMQSGRAARPPTTGCCSGLGSCQPEPTRCWLCSWRRPGQSACWSRTATSPPANSAGFGLRRTRPTQSQHCGRHCSELWSPAASKLGGPGPPSSGTRCRHTRGSESAGSERPSGGRTCCRWPRAGPSFCSRAAPCSGSGSVGRSVGPASQPTARLPSSESSPAMLCRSCRPRSGPTEMGSASAACPKTSTTGGGCARGATPSGSGPCRGLRPQLWRPCRSAPACASCRAGRGHCLAELLAAGPQGPPARQPAVFPRR